MNDQQASDQQRHSVDFLLAEYQSLTDSFWRNEESGEKRVNFFITLVTAVIAALVALVTSQEETFKKENAYAIAVYALLALLSFGIITLLRMIRRNQVTDEYKQALGMIRGYFRNWDERLQNYRPFESKARKPGTGGLVDMVALINSLIAGALGALLAISHSRWIMGLSGMVGFILALGVQLSYVKYRYDVGKANRR